MYRTSKKLVAWSLIIALAIISGAGEGLHCIPGCGHSIDVGGRVLFVGMDLTGYGYSYSTPNGDRLCVARSEDYGVPTWDEDDCPICSLLGQYSTSAGFVQFVLVVPFAHDLPLEAVCTAPSPTSRLCQARAPPLA